MMNILGTLLVICLVSLGIQLVFTCERFEPEEELYFYTDTIIQESRSTYQFQGAVVHIGKETLIQHGFCWSVSENPKVDTDSVSALGARNKAGKFSSTVEGLKTSTRYYVRTFMETENKLVYGDQLSFETPDPAKPVVRTHLVSNITENSAESGGSILDDGGAVLSASGICWDSLGNPDISSKHTVDERTENTFSSQLSNLKCATRYYLRAYAINAAGIGYGDTLSFMTEECPIIEKPTVNTTTYSNLTETSVECGGHVTDEGGGSVSEKGVCWSQFPEPEISDKHKSMGDGLGVYTSVIEGLSCNTTYYLRAYAINSAGISYGEQLEIKTDICTSVTDIDDNVYPAVKIGDQVWMAENLRVTHFPDSSQINHVADSADWAALGVTNAAYCWHENNPENKEIYGALYTWAAAMHGAGSSQANPSGVQGVCPHGWHLPSDEEWKQLEMHLGMSQVEADNMYWRGSIEGTKLKEEGTSHWWKSGIEGSNTTKFAARGAAARHYTGYFQILKQSAFFWTSTQTDSQNAWDRHLYCLDERIHRKDNNKGHGLSVRCVMNE